MTIERPTWRHWARRASCVALFSFVGWFVGFTCRTPAYAIFRRLLAPIGPTWNRIAEFVVMYDDEIGRASLILGTALGLVAGILVVRAFRRSRIPRSAFVLGACCIVATWLLAVDFKLLAVPASLGAAVLHYRHVQGRASTRGLVAAWMVFAVVSLAPLDVSLANYPGRVRFVRVEPPFVYTVEGLRAADAGEFFIDGLAGHYAPFMGGTWILIW